MFNTVIYLLIINTLNDSLCKKVVDYFDENFDENKNCKHEAEMKQLMDDKDDNHEYHIDGAIFANNSEASAINMALDLL